MINKDELVTQLFDQRSQLLAMLERRINGGGPVIDIRIEIDKVDKMIEQLLSDDLAAQLKNKGF